MENYFNNPDILYHKNLNAKFQELENAQSLNEAKQIASQIKTYILQYETNLINIYDTFVCFYNKQVDLFKRIHRDNQFAKGMQHYDAFDIYVALHSKDTSIIKTHNATGECYTQVDYDILDYYTGEILYHPNCTFDKMLSFQHVRMQMASKKKQEIYQQNYASYDEVKRVLSYANKHLKY